MYRLEEIAEVSAGQGAPQGDSFYSEDGIPFVRAGSLDSLLNGGTLNDLEKIKPAVGKKEGLRLFPKGSVLFAKSGMSAMKDRVFVLPEDAFVVSHLAVIIPKKELDENFFRYWMSSFKPSSLIRDKSYPSIRLEDVSQIRFPKISREEQQKIAATLEQADTARQKRKQANQLTEQFLQSAFLEMFGDPVRNEKGWEVVTIEEVTKAIKDGPHVSPEYADSGIPILSARNIRPYELNLDDVKYVSEEKYAELTKMFKPQKGDVLLTKGGTTGFAKKVDFDWSFCIWVHVAALRPIDSRIHFGYLEAVLNSQFCYAQSQNLTKGIANRDLGLKRIAKIILPLPPLSLQKKFASLVAQTEKLRGKQRESERELENLFQSLMQRYFE